MMAMVHMMMLMMMLSSSVAEDDVTVMAEQNDAECDNIDEDCSNVTVCRPRPKWLRNSAMTRP